MSAALAMNDFDDENAPLPWEQIWITRFTHKFAPAGRREQISWFDLCREFMRPLVVSDKERAPLWSPATFKTKPATDKEPAKPDYRKKDNVELAYCLGLDFDDLPPAEPGDPMQGLGAVCEALRGYQALIVTSYSHTLAKPKGRAILPFSRPVRVVEYERIAMTFQRVLGVVGTVTDTACKDASRAWYVPSKPSDDAPSIAKTTNDDDPIDVDAVLATIRRNERPKPVAKPVRFSAKGGKEIERCRNYIATMNPAIQEAKGSNATYRAAIKIVQLFDLSPAEQWAALCEYNATKCTPPWSEKELRHKLDDARKAPRK